MALYFLSRKEYKLHCHLYFFLSPSLCVYICQVDRPVKKKWLSIENLHIKLSVTVSVWMNDHNICIYRCAFFFLLRYVWSRSNIGVAHTHTTARQRFENRTLSRGKMQRKTHTHEMKRANKMKTNKNIVYICRRRILWVSGMNSFSSLDCVCVCVISIRRLVCSIVRIRAKCDVCFVSSCLSSFNQNRFDYNRFHNNIVPKNNAEAWSFSNSIQWTQSEINADWLWKPVRLIDFWWYHFVNTNDNSVKISSLAIIITWYWWDFFSFWGFALVKIIRLRSIYFRTGSVSWTNYLSTTCVFSPSEDQISSFKQIHAHIGKLISKPQCWKCCDSRLFIFVYRIRMCASLNVINHSQCVMHVNTEWIAKINTAKLFSWRAIDWIAFRCQPRRSLIKPST